MASQMYTFLTNQKVFPRLFVYVCKKTGTSQNENGVGEGTVFKTQLRLGRECVAQRIVSRVNNRHIQAFVGVYVVGVQSGMKDQLFMWHLCLQ